MSEERKAGLPRGCAARNDAIEGGRVQANRHRVVQLAQPGRRKLFGRAAKRDFLEWFAATANLGWSARQAGFNYKTVLKHRLKDPVFAEAYDRALQQGFVRLLGREMPEDEARLWLFTVATNLFRDGARTRKRRERLLSVRPWTPTALPRPDEAAERAATVKAVRGALDTLAERDRQMLLMREEGFRYDEIAKVVGVAPGSVGTLLARAARRFVAAWDNGGNDGEQALG